MLDAELLATADKAIRPAHGELHDRGWHADHLTVTDDAGVLAGEEIAARLLATVLRAEPDRRGRLHSNDLWRVPEFGRDPLPAVAQKRRPGEICRGGVSGLLHVLQWNDRR